MAIQVVSVSGYPDGRNEDYVAVAAEADEVAVVVDGVTPPRDGDTGCRHTVSWFAEHLGSTLLRTAVADRDRPLADCLAGAIRDTAARHESTCDLSHRRTPQATVAALRRGTDRIEYLVLSDAALLLAGRDGVVTPVLDGRLNDVRARPEVRAARARSLAEYGNLLEELRNAPDGYFTAAADPGVVTRAVTGSVPTADIAAAAVLSDGATRWTEVFRFGDWTALFKVLRTEGAQALVDRVRAAEAADPDRTAFPRGKQYDDASVAYLEF